MEETVKKKVDDKLIYQVLIAFCLGIIIISGSLLYFENPSYIASLKFGPLFGATSVVILLGMFGLYRYAYTFYQDYFYQFLSIGWLLNAIYICFETFFKPEVNDLDYNFKVYTLGIMTSLPFHIARFKPKENEPINYRSLILSTLKWFLWLVVSAAFSYWVIEIFSDSLNKSAKFAILTIGGIPFAFWVLWKVGESVRSRVDSEVHKGWAVVFPLTFFIYAALQPIYLFKLWLSDYAIMEYVFVVALLPKIVNSISALKLIQLDTAKVQQQLEQRTVLEDLGALTTSIQHDINNPLEVIETELLYMKKKFQSQPEVLGAVKRLEEQKKRIHATTQIIPIIQGGQQYYERFMEKVNVKDLINRSIKAIKKEMTTDDIYFKVENKDYFIRAYSPMLEQAIVNIIKNAVEAIKLSGDGGGTIRVTFERIDQVNNNKVIKIDFEDTGGGIPEEILPEVDKLFMTTRSKEKPNSGIGLFITKRILKVHKGWLEIKNNDFPGVTVTIFLPQWINKNYI